MGHLRIHYLLPKLKLRLSPKIKEEKTFLSYKEKFKKMGPKTT